MRDARGFVAMMAAMAEGARASTRIEAKLDALLKEQGYDVDELNRKHADAGSGVFTLISPDDGAAGTGGDAVAGGAPDYGDGPNAGRNRGAMDQARRGPAQ